MRYFFTSVLYSMFSYLNDIDGAWRSIENAELLEIAKEAKEPNVVCTALEDVVLNNQQDMVDNYTIVTVFVDRG